VDIYDARLSKFTGKERDAESGLDYMTLVTLFALTVAGAGAAAPDPAASQAKLRSRGKAAPLSRSGRYYSQFVVYFSRFMGVVLDGF